MYLAIATAAAAGRAGTRPRFCGPSMPEGFPLAKDEDGEWIIDPAELHRIYPPLRSASMKDSDMQPRLHQSPLLTPV